MKKQRILSSLLAVAMTFSLLPSTVGAASGAKVFSDVSKDSWYYKYVDHVAEEGYFGGTSATTFSPDMTMDRAQFAVVLAAVEGVEVDNNVAPFADVPAGTWYSGAVAWAAENGIVAGGDNNKYYPTTPINREQMAVIMNAYINWHNNEQGTEHNENVSVDGFADAKDISSWAVAAVDACRTYGLIAGSDDGNFYPKASATRAQVATVIYNLSFFMLGGGGGGGGKDYIYDAINAALKDISGDLKDNGFELGYGKVGKDEFVALSYGLDYNDREWAYAQITLPGGSTKKDGAFIKATKTLDENGARPQDVYIHADLADDTLYTIAKTALNYATGLLYGDLEVDDVTGAVRANYDDIKACVMGFVEKFEEITGVNVSIEQRDQMIADTVEYIKAYGGSLSKNFRDDNGVYYTGDVTIEANGATAVINVGTSASFSGDKVEKAIELAEAIARDLHGSLAEKYTGAEWTPVEDVTIGTTINVTFADNAVEGNKYANATAKKPHKYPINVTLNFVSEEIGKLVSYRYNNGRDEIMLTVSEANQARYEKYADKAVNKIIDTFLDDPALAGEIDAVKESVANVEQVKAMIDALGTLYGDAAAASDFVMNQIVVWFNANQAAVIKYVSGSAALELNNTAIYAIVYEIANEATDYAVVVMDEEMDDLLESLREQAYQSAYEAAVNTGIAADRAEQMANAAVDAAMPTIQEQINLYVQEMTMDDAKGILVDQMGDAINDVPAELLEFVLASVVEEINGSVNARDYRIDAEDKIDDLINPVVVTKAQPIADAYADELELVNKVLSLTDFDTVMTTPVESVINLLKKPDVEAKIDEFVAQLGEESLFNRLTNLVNKLPEGASVSLANITIDRDTLAYAVEQGHICDAVIAILEQAPALKLADFEYGLPLTVTYGGREHTMGLYIYAGPDPVG